MKTQHKIGTREEWLKARVDLLKAEKELTRKSDELAKRRRELPWVRVEKNYSFETEKGKARLADLFEGRSQLMIYHFMFGPDFKAGCPSCSSIADGFNGVWPHWANHDVMFWAVSRAPYAKLATFKMRMGWSFPWASSGDSDFNADYSAGFSEKQQAEGGIEYNYVKEAPMVPLPPGAGPVNFAAMAGTNVATYIRERPGMSSFIREDGEIYHTYSAYSRGLDVLWNMYQWLDRAPKGRNETGDIWFKHRDQY